MANMFKLPEPARDRIIRMVNVHFDADENVINEFFDGFEILDQIRANNVRTGTNSIIYILFASIADKIRAGTLSGHELVGREINIQPARDGNFKLNEDETAFIRLVSDKQSNRKLPNKEKTPVDTPDRAAPAFDESDFPALGPVPVKETPKDSPALPIPEPEITENPAVTTGDSIVAALKELEMNIDNDVGHQENEKKSKGLLYKTFRGAAESHQNMLKVGDVASENAVTVNFYWKAAQIKAEDASPVSIPSEPRGPPAGVNTSMPPPSDFKNWNLNGHDAYEKAKNLITPDAWYNFDANQFRKVQEDQKAKTTNADRVTEKDGGFYVEDNGKSIWKK